MGIFFSCPRTYILGNVDDFRAVELYAVNYVVWRLLVLWSSWSNREFHEEKGVRGPVHVLARELITRENNIIERIIGQESETPLSAGPLITSLLFHVNVLHDI